MPFPQSLEMPQAVHRRRRRFRHPRRSCRDDRPYFTMAWTVSTDLTVGALSPMWTVDRDYYIASCKMSIGHHTEGGHPASDGTPSGTDVTAQFYRITGQSGNGSKILQSDSRLRVEENRHHDSVNDDDDGNYTDNDMDIKRLRKGDWVFPSILQIGSGRPGTYAELSIICVPYAHPDLDDDVT